MATASLQVTVWQGTTLGQSLKVAGAVATGGEAKARIEAGEVKVNGEAEERRGRKMRDGDRVEIAGRVILVRVASDDSDASPAG